ncbi:helix-turn-helix domain-containing protein [Psychrobacter sp. F1192]|uniref:Helix-turn-helix domain-containing protein n=1 Tax=Psychrobacter coccoides TaxID=2818440 RepID=A0ABS3NJR5_9GAMM|nr:Cro/CI family transcriptional regulator [Psychrobacter coccoides]MBO1529626.1 helix-turn-helix domain-containing protein [Psychrobacter coccoides]
MPTLYESYSQLIARFGGQQKTAEALGCTQPSVSAWVQGKANMSATLALKAERITNGEFKAVDLCPALALLETTD